VPRITLAMPRTYALRGGVLAAVVLASLSAGPAAARTEAVRHYTAGGQESRTVDPDASPRPPGVASAIIGVSSPRDARALAAELRMKGLQVWTMPRIGTLEVSGGTLDSVRTFVADDSRVRWVEPPRDRSLFVVAPATMDAFSGRAYDWMMDSVDSAQALDSMPEDLPVKVAVVDSGIDTGHPDLAGRIGTTYDVLTGGAGVQDLVGHGTFVAGLISAIDGNGIGGHGVAGATTVLPIRITTNGSIKSTDAAAGIVEAVDSGAGVVNLSFGGSSISEVEKSALAYAAANDVLVVAAAGNSYQYNNPVQYPAAAIGGVKGSWSPGLSVAATDPLGKHASFSTANDFVSVAAPGAGSGQCGDGVFSTVPANPTLLWDDASRYSCTRLVDVFGTTGGRYGYGEGTSFAAPLVAGAAALVRDANPDLTAEQAADVIKRSAHQTVGSGWNSQTGAGVLDVDAAVDLARVYDTGRPAPSLTVTRGSSSLAVALSATDTTGARDMLSGMASYGLEGSSDGAAFATLVAARSTPIRFEENVATGKSRWYRGTVCDAAHNCNVAVSGPFAPNPPLPSAKTAATVPPGMQSLAAARPGTCGTCVRVTFTGVGTGPLKWAIAITPKSAGVKPIRRTGVVPADGRVVATVPLSRIPTCRGRLALAISLSSPYGTTHASRTLSVDGACAPVTRR
jgi:subtilisin family serine protease